jgi:GMP synthase (glutamine-hydrolysing)
MDYQKFIEQQIEAIRNAVGDGLAINALSGGVDSAVVTVLGHRALGQRLRTFFVDNALMRQGEPEAWSRHLRSWASPWS